MPPKTLHVVVDNTKYANKMSNSIDGLKKHHEKNH